MRAILLLALLPGLACAQVQTAADAALGSFTTILAPGALALVNYTPASDTPVPSATVSFLPATTTAPVAAQVINITTNAIAFVVPPGLPAGDALLTFKPGAQATQWTRVSIVPANLSLFRSGSIGPLRAQNIRPDGSPVSNGLVTPAQPGQAVVLWGTGLGATSPDAVQIKLGGVAQQVLYAGNAPGQPGLNQINFLVAPGTPDGCYVPITVTYGPHVVTSFLSKTSDGLPCHHPFNLTTDTMQLLDNGSQIQTGAITLSTGIQAPAADRASRQESAQLIPRYLSASDIANYFTGATPDPAQPCGISGSTILSGGIEGGSGQDTFGTITLRNGTTSLVLPASPQAADTTLASLPAPSIRGGQWTATSAGSATLPPQSFDFALPPPVQIAGSAPLAFDRTQNQTITWDGSGFDSTAVLQLSVAGSYLPTPVVTCSVPAQSGTVTLPSKLLAQFTSGSIGALTVLVTETGTGIPHAQLKPSSGGPFLALVNWTSTDVRPVDFQ